MVALGSLGDVEAALCWVAPVAEESELATEDPLALDYLAQQVGLMLLPTLTSRSNRAQAFAMVLYGLHLAELAIRRYGLSPGDASRRAGFERWERFWALATLEFHQGELPRGASDVMRGVRGARNAWRPGGAALALDYSLISRQQELGNLGAYLSPLRRAGLVLDGTLRPSPAALEIIDAFWDEPDNKHRSRYEEYALLALEPKRLKIERSNANLSLGKVGEMSRLSALVERGRAAQQRRLYDVLFARARDATTLAVSRLVEAAAGAGVTEPRQLLERAGKQRLGAIEAGLREQLLTALRFGDVTDALLAAFDRVYAFLHAHGSVAKVAAVVKEAFDASALAELGEACRALLASPRLGELQRLPMHGGACVRLVEELAGPCDGGQALSALVRYHDEVQRERLRGRGWMQLEQGELLLKVSTYTALPEADRFPSLKLPTVRVLLRDLGRLS